MTLFVCLLLLLSVVLSQRSVFLCSCYCVECGRFVGECTSLQGTKDCDVVDTIVIGHRSLFKVAVENKTVTRLYESSRYYSSSECSDDPVLVITTM